MLITRDARLSDMIDNFSSQEYMTLPKLTKDFWSNRHYRKTRESLCLTICDFIKTELRLDPIVNIEKLGILINQKDSNDFEVE